MSSSEVRGIILVVHPDRRMQRVVHRVLGASRLAVDAVDAAADARRQLRQRTPEILIVAASVLSSPDGRALLAESATGGNLGTIVLANDAAAGDVPMLLDLEPLAHLATHDMPLLAEELVPTVHKLVSQDLFGIEKYLAWGSEVRAVRLTNVADRRGAVDGLARDVRELGLGPRIASMSSMVCDELLSNALFDAPVDGDGAPTRIADDRHAPRALADREQVTLRYACDGRYLALEIEDRFGSLDRATILHHLGKALVRSTDRVDLEGPGAGMGIALAYSCCTQLVYNLSAGERTQAIALLDVRHKPRELAGPAPAFGIFEKGPA